MTNDQRKQLEDLILAYGRASVDEALGYGAQAALGQKAREEIWTEICDTLDEIGVKYPRVWV